MGTVDRVTRFCFGCGLGYLGLFKSAVIDDALLNFIIVTFGCMNVLSALFRICPAYLLVNFSTAKPTAEAKAAGHPLETSSLIEHSGEIVKLRRKLKLSVALPMLALLGIFGSIVVDLDHQFELSTITRKTDLASAIASNYLSSQSNTIAHTGYQQDKDIAQSILDNSLASTPVFFLHDSTGRIIPSAFDKGVGNSAILAQAQALIAANSLKSDATTRGVINIAGKNYIWASYPVGLSDRWFMALTPNSRHMTLSDQLFSSRFLVIILAVVWLAIWSSTYVVRKFIDKMEDNARTLNHRTLHDALTGLANRVKVSQLVMQRAQSLKPGKESIVLLLIDLVDFRDINDTLGYKLGDQLLIQVAGQLKGIATPKTDIGRMGGDVFCLMAVTQIDRIQASRLSNAVHDTLEHIHELNGIPIAVQARIGMAFYPSDSEGADELIRFADIALAQAKAQRLKDCYYQHEQDTHSIRKLTLLARLRTAIEQDELTLVYQPKVDIAAHTLVGVEVLVRWNDSQYGQVSPVEFVTWAEKSGLIDKLTRWVLTAAEKQCREWRNRGLSIPVAINLSPTNLYDTELVSLLTRLIEHGSFGNGMLELEITENAVMEDPEKALQTMLLISKMGVSFAIDDFGTGLSSFAYLRKLPVSNLKIDRAFIMDTDESDRDAILLRSMIELGHGLGCVVTAEGVEDQSSMDKLRTFGCDYVQGYFVGKPMSADLFLRWLESSDWVPVSKAA